MSIRDFKCLCPQKTPTFMVRPVPAILPEGSEINRRKSNPERKRFMTREGIELELPGGGLLGDSFMELDKAGWAGHWPHSTWKDSQGRQAASGLEEEEFLVLPVLLL